MKSRHDSTAALDRLESAVHLLRATPAGDRVLWLAGAGPFALALLYFWADQSRSSTAAEHLPVSSLGLALLFLWARLTQAVFAGRLHARLAGLEVSDRFFTSLRRVAVPIGIWQPLALALLPVALVLVVPFPAYLAFQQGLIVTAHRSDGRPLRNASLALRHSLYEPKQASQEVSLLSLVWLILLINSGVVLYFLPQLLKLFLGVESPFTLSPAALLNTTFAATVVVLATLLTDPLTKALFAVRDFEAEARTTGADLIAALRRIPPTGLLALLIFLGVPHVGGEVQAATPDAAPASMIPSTELNRAIVEVLDRPEFTWREPRPEKANEASPSDRSLLERLLASAGQWLKAIGRHLEAPVKALADWLGRLFSGRPPPTPAPLKLDLSGFIEFLMWLMLVGGGAVLGWFGVRLWRQRQGVPSAAAPHASTVPDLEADHVAAEQLPEDGWLALARELAARGEHRLALRALFLAGLAGLAGQQWIRLTPTKSNRDYETELRRRTRDRPELAETFAELVRIFERTWYGNRPVTPDRVADFAAAVDRLHPS